MARIATRTTAILLALLFLGASACSDGGSGSSGAHPEDDFTYAVSHVHIASKNRKANATFERVLMVTKALREGMRTGRYRGDVDPEAFVATLIAVFDGLLYRSTFDPDRAHAEQLRHSFRILLDSIRVTAAEGSRAPEENDRGR